jgi:hypothetical protein
MSKIRFATVRNGLALLAVVVVVVIVGAPFLGLGSKEQFVLYLAFGVSRTLAVKITVSILLAGLIFVVTYRAAPSIRVVAHNLRTKIVVAARALRTKSIIAAHSLCANSIIAAHTVRRNSIIAAHTVRRNGIIVAHNFRMNSIVAAQNLRIKSVRAARHLHEEIILATGVLFGIPQKSTQVHEPSKAVAIDRSYVLCVSINFICFIGVMYLSFFRNRGHIFAGLDGSYVLTIVRDQPVWALRGIGFSANLLQGLGDIWFPMNAQMLPGYLIPTQLLGIEAIADAKFQALSYTVFASELFLASGIVGRTVGLGRATSLLGAWLAPVLLFPVTGVPLIYPRLGIMPSLASTISEAMLLTALFARLGRNRGWIGDTVSVLLAIFLTGHLIVAQPSEAFLCAPMLVVLLLGLAMGSETRREIIAKILGFALVALILSITGFAYFLVGLFIDTSAWFWAEKFARFGTTAYEISILFQTEAWGYSGFLLYCLALLGLTSCLLTADRRHSRFAAAVLCAVALLFAFGGLMFVFDVWRGPTSVYFEIVMVPIYALFAMHFVVGLTVQMARQLAKAKADRVELWSGNPVVMGGVFALLLVLVSKPNGVRSFPFPPVKTPLVATLGESIAISPGAPFRGRVATFQAQDVHGKTGWLQLHALDSGRVAATGNDYHMVGMWFYEIPTLIENNRAMSPAFYRLATYLLARPDDVQMRNVVVLRRIVPSVLAMLGVRYVVTDLPQPTPLKLILQTQTTPPETLRTYGVHGPNLGTETLYLYEVPNPNLGRWGVIESRKVRSFDAALDAVADPNFDPARTAIFIDSVDNGDVPAQFDPVDGASLKLVRGGMLVEASSPGTSLLVLPFEFSHCLSVSVPVLETTGPRLLRVNGIEIGLLFSGTIRTEIRYFNGPFAKPNCRIRDAADFSRLIGG